VAATLSTVLARPIAFHERTLEEDAQEMIDAGVPAAIAEMNAHAVSLIAEGDAAWLSQDVATVSAGALTWTRLCCGVYIV
jgi:hypothetical protein